jgi:hypothetical protein
MGKWNEVEQPAEGDGIPRLRRNVRQKGRTKKPEATREPKVRYSGFTAMSKHTKVFEHIMTRRSDSNVTLSDLCEPLTRLGFDRRMTGIEEIINLQPKHGMGKAYQVRQVRDVLLKYKLRMEE